MYHPHLRPLTTPLATLLSASAEGHKFIRSQSQLPIPTPAGVLEMLASRLESSHFTPTYNRSGQHNPGEGGEGRKLGGWLATALRSSANAMQIPPMHVDHVALATCTAIEHSFASDSKSTTFMEHGDEDGKNVVLGVSEMRELIGWRWEDDYYHCASSHSPEPHSE